MKLTKGMTVEQISDAIQQHLQTAQYIGDGILRIKAPVSAIHVGDTDKVSIQASENHYSKPRQDSAIYTHVEIGFPSFHFSKEFIDKYAEDTNEPTETVYGYVPLELTAQEIYHYLNK